MTGNHMTLCQMLEYGPIVAFNEEFGLFVTINGSYLNLWVQRGKDGYENTEVRSFGDIELNQLKWVDAVDLAEKYLGELLDGIELKDEA
jgi:hypothetical protein